jgi:multiple sugar transport system permease protein
LRALRHSLPHILLYVVLTVVACMTLTPLVWLLASALKSSDAFFHYTFFPPPWETESYTLSNFTSLFREIPFLRFLMNSFFVSGTTVVLQLFFTSLGGFALAKYQFRGKSVIMAVMLGTMMIPSQVLLAPLYELVYGMHLMDSFAGLILPGMVSVFGMFLFRQSMLSIPDELLDAGRIDGCSEFGLYWNIAMPVSRPMVGAFCLIAYMATWNAFLWPQIILHTQDRFTLPIGLNQMVGVYYQDYGVLMAGTLLSIMPVVVLFFILQKEFISGLTAGAVKG